MNSKPIENQYAISDVWFPFHQKSSLTLTAYDRSKLRRAKGTGYTFQAVVVSYIVIDQSLPLQQVKFSNIFNVGSIYLNA
jgi:hypothetical protein